MQRILTALILFACALPAQRAKTYDEFVQKLDQHIRLSDKARLDRLMKDNPAQVIRHYRGLVLASLKDPSDTGNRDTRESMEASWTRSYESDTLERLNRWLQTLSSGSYNADEKAQGALYKAWNEFIRMRDQKVTDRRSWESLRDSLMQIARAFEGTGNVLDSAETWGLLSQVNNSMPEKTLADRRDAVYAIERFKEFRDRWSFTKDPSYAQNNNWGKAEKEAIKLDEEAAAKRESEGYAGEIKGVDSFLVPDADKSEIVSELTFEMLKKQKADMNFKGGPIPMSWAAVRTGAVESLAQIKFFTKRELFVARTGASKFGVSLEGTPDVFKNKGVIDVDAKNRIKKASLFHLDDKKQFPYAMWFWVGGDQESFQGLNHNVSPVKDGASVYFKSASSWVADVAGTPVTFYDDNCNGELFDNPDEAALMDRHVGGDPSKSVAVPMFDGMSVGKKGKPMPLSDWLQIDGAWYHARVKDGGVRVGFRKANAEYLKTGKVELDWTAGKKTQPAVLIIRGEGDFANARFDIASGKPVDVPAGKYTLAYGRIESGRGARMMTCNIFPGAMEAFEVEVGKTVSVSIGKPFKLDFERGGSNSEAHIDAIKMRVVGKSGEIYTHINGAAPAPAVVVAGSKTAKRGKEVAEFVPIPSPDVLGQLANKNPNLSIEVGFYSMPKGSRDGSTVLKVPVKKGQFVGLQEKKNALFGPLDPIFK